MYYELQFNGGQSVTLHLDAAQQRNLSLRKARRCEIPHGGGKVLKAVTEAASSARLDGIAVEYGLCDVSRLEKISVHGAKRILKCLIAVYGEFPRLRAYVTYLGGVREYRDIIARAAMGDGEVKSKLGLDGILNRAEYMQLAAYCLEEVNALVKRREEYFAAALSSGGFFGGIVFDAEKYNPDNYFKSCEAHMIEESQGFNPQGCRNLNSVFYHEAGHLLDYMCGVTESEGFKRLISGYSAESIGRLLSSYAASCPEETVAEAVSEYFCNPKPRAFCLSVMEEVKRAYNSFVR